MVHLKSPTWMCLCQSNVLLMADCTVYKAAPPTYPPAVSKSVKAYCTSVTASRLERHQVIIPRFPYPTIEYLLFKLFNDT